jgi:hypothetical protein
MRALAAIFVGVVVLYAIRVAVFYVALGRTTLRERDGSGFVDLDVFEEGIFGRSGGDSDQNTQQALTGC